MNATREKKRLAACLIALLVLSGAIFYLDGAWLRIDGRIVRSGVQARQAAIRAMAPGEGS